MRAASALIVAFLCACRSTNDPPLTQVGATAEAIDARTVEVRFTHDLADGSFIDLGTLRAFAPFIRPLQTLEVNEATFDGSILTLHTGLQLGGELYAVELGELAFEDVERADAPKQINFRGYGKTNVVVSLDARGLVAPASIDALITVDPRTGEYSDALLRLPLERTGPETFTATVAVRIDASRLYGARAIGSDGLPAAQLSTFRVESRDVVHVGLVPVLPAVPEFSAPPDPRPNDGFAPVRVVLDDRYARELARPELKVSIDQNGRFDLGSRNLALTRVPGKGRVYEAVFEVAVDPARNLSGMSPSDFPYVAFLVEAGEDIPQRGTTFEMKEERPQVIVIPIGNPALVPVTFRIDAGAAALEPDLAVTGKYPDEGFFLTGELPSAEDGLGRLAADAFTGGERSTLEMRERPDALGVYEKTIFLPPGRPYSWKVVRCPSGVGCAELNRHVLSSGRAFPTVMKNLVTANIDAASDPNVRVIDPRSPLEYASARVSLEGMEPPSTAILFKQEAPDLVVTVARTPVITPIVIVGTWRDVNIPERPSELIANGSTVDLQPFDYDDGLQGRAPLERALVLPIDPGEMMRTPGVPAFDPIDGARDAAADTLLPGPPSLALGWNDRELYVATEPAAAGTDRFVLIAFDPPGALRAAQWAKGGRVALAPRHVFLAMEGDGAFVSWYRYGSTPATDVRLQGAGVRLGAGAVLEGAIEPMAAGIGTLRDRIWVAVLTYQSPDNGPLSAQSPTGNANLDIEETELREVVLSEIRSD